MKYFFSTLASLILLHINILAQENTKSNRIDQDKENYEKKIFDKEFGELHDTCDSNKKQYDRIPEKLPEWVFKSLHIGNMIQVIGFSDPNMEKEEAFQQAKLRAKAMFALLKLSTISNITDDYTNIRESNKYSLYETKFQDFSLSKAVVPYNNSIITLVDSFYTKYNEGIVLIEFNLVDSEQNKDTLVVKNEHLQIYLEKNFKKEKIEFFNFSVQDNLNENDSSETFLQYNYKGVNRSFDISSIYGTKNIEFEERTYSYRTEMEFSQDSSDSELNMFRLNRGLWNGYISGVLSNITILSKQLASQIKNTNDFYTLKSQGLVRTVAHNEVSFNFNNFKMIENQFYIDLSGQIRF